MADRPLDVHGLVGGGMAGLVLAGGRSSRMRSADDPEADKGLRTWGDGPLVARVCRYVRDQGIETLWISANRNQQIYAGYGRVITDPDDLVARDSGALAGVLAGLTHAEEDWLFVLPVDVIRWPDGLLARLCASAEIQHPAYAVTLDGPHPLCMVVHRRMAGSLRDFLEAGERQVQAWLRACGARPVAFPVRDCLVNLNTPADWAAWQHQAT